MQTQESARSAALHRFDILDTPRESEFDEIAAIAAEVCQTPIGIVNFVDTTRQFFKAEVGLGVRETPLDTAFCGHALLSEDMMIVPDAQQDPRFVSNPLVTQRGGLRFYAGVLLKTADGHPIGTVCVLDHKPRTLDEHQVRTLRLLARQVMTQLELRRALTEARNSQAKNRQILDSSIDYAILSLDLDGNVSSWNRGAQNVLGWSEDEMLGNPASIIFNSVDRTVGIPDLEMKAARETGRGADERWHVRKDGSHFFALGEMMPLRDDAGRHTGYVKILRDRTNARRQAQRLALLSQASAALLNTDDPAGTLRPILEGSADMIGFDQCYLYDLADDGQHLFLRHSVGAGEEVQMALRHVALDVPLCGIVAQQEASLILSNLQDDTDPRYGIARSLGVKAYAGFPICVGQKLIGVISFGSSDIDSFDEEALQFFQTIARFLSVARERADDARALRDAERRSRSAQQAGGVGTFELDVKTGVIIPSPEFCQIFGLSEAPSYPAALIEDLVVDKDTALRSNAEQRRTGNAPPDVEYRICRANDGQQRWIARKAEFMADDVGHIRTMFGTVQDVTGRKVTELRQAALLQLGRAVRHATSCKDIANIACHLMLEMMEVSRAGYAVIDRRAGRYVIAGECLASGIAELHQSYNISDFTETVNQLALGEPLVLRNAAAEARVLVDLDAYRHIDVMAQISIPQIEKGELIGALFVHQLEAREWTDGEIDFMRRVADRVYAAMATVKAEAEQAILNHELAHRLKNSLSMVQAIAGQTLRSSTQDVALKDFLRRIQALSGAHDVLLHRNWEAGEIEDTVRSTLGNLAESHRIRISGPQLACGPKSTLTLSMLLHELGTNAIKYGALSGRTGRVEVTWSLQTLEADETDLFIRWEEIGGPPVAEPSRKGFGSRLIGLGLLGAGGVELCYNPSGLVATIRAPFSDVQHS